ncbi:MAG: cell filamentation protein Fic [Clostridia bacterium]|nr:cell filamentation protein Fic [Clostridia bacterium]
MPYVFTEQGIAMLSALLKSDIAVNVSIQIMKAFIEMRNFLFYNGQVFQEINTIKSRLLEHDGKFDIVFDELQNKKQSEFNQKIFFNGQIYDSYSLIIDIIKSAKNKILIIDNYIDDSILKMLAKKNKDVEVVILTSQNSNISKLDINKFNKQYSTLKVDKTDKFHDRFIVIDNKKLYHCGASLKDLGKKCFAISKMENIKFINDIENMI